jgi:arylsulfatase A-like enzyme
LSPRSAILPIAAGLLWLCGCAGDAAPEAQPDAEPAGRSPTSRRPDVVIHLIDTLRADRLGLYGCEQDNSPSLDAFAKRAAVFENAISQGPWTLPSVASLFTSSFPTSHQVLSVADAVSSETVTMTEFFHDLGYHTVGWTENTLAGRGGGLDQGYDEFRERLPPNRAPPGGEPDFLRDLFERVVRYDGEQPLFLYLHTVEPHDPWEGTARPRQTRFAGTPAERDELNALVGEHRGLIADSLNGRLDEAGAARLDELDAIMTERLPDILDLYDGDVLRADRNFQTLLNALSERSRQRETIVVVLSDHGEELLDHGHWFHGQSLYQELVRVPLLMRLPGLAERGQRIAEPVRLIDVLPTLADAVGAEALPGWQGRSLLPLLRGEPSSAPEPILSMKISVDRPVGGELGDVETAFWNGGEKLIVHHDHQSASLFDLQDDPSERSDLWEQRRGRGRELLAEVQRLLGGLPSLGIVDGGRPLDADKLEHLIELGYVDRR